MKTTTLAMLLASLLWSISIQAADGTLRRQIDSYRRGHEAQIIGELDRLTRIRSVAADPAGLAAAADQLAGWLRQRGFQARTLSAGNGLPPLVFGALTTAGARRTVVFYAHYDGQPVNPAQWRSDPFAPVMRSGPLGSTTRDIDWRSVHSTFDPQWRLFGRAVADDKASIVAFLSAFDALKAIGRRPSINIKVVWEGEEEAGSPHLEQALRANQQLLASDLWLIGDAPVHQSRRPMLYFGARGILGLRLTVYGPLTALHDGHYGNWAPNPAVMAANLIAKMRDDNGRILIPGLAEHVRALTPAERQALRDLPPIDAQLEHEFAIGRTESQDGLAQSLMRPALNVRGIRAGEVGNAAPNAIPSDADVSIDFRLVPDQQPNQVRASVEQFLRAQGWTLLTQAPDAATRQAHARVVRVQWEAGYPGLRSDMASAAGRAVIRTAQDAAGGPVALLPMMGASVPIYLFDEVFKRPVIGLPIVNHDDDQHAPNENLRLQNLWDGIQTYAAMIGELSW